MTEIIGINDKIAHKTTFSCFKIINACFDFYTFFDFFSYIY